MRTFAYAALITIILACAVTANAKIGYNAEVRRITHNGQVYDFETWDAKVIWHATFFDDWFRRQFAEKHAQIKHMGPLEAAQWLADQEYIQSREWDFFITFYTKKDYKKFSMDSDSFWQICMTTANGDVVWPTSIEEVHITPYERVMFRHITRWSKAYKVSFPKVEIGESMKLTLQSIVGDSTLTWKFFENPVRDNVKRGKGKYSN